MTGVASVKILILAKNIISATEIELSCRCQKISLRKMSNLNFYAIAKDCYQALNWTSSEKDVPFRSVMATLVKLAIKRIQLLKYKIFEFEFICNPSCTNHVFPSRFNSWYSTSASRLGFPWTRDTFFNSLAIFRDDLLDLYCFGYGTSIDYIHRINQRFEVLPVKNSTDAELIGRWKSTKFFQFRDSSIIHGNVLVCSAEVFLKDFSLQSYRFPAHMIPNAVWLNSSSVDSCITPAVEIESILQGPHIFVDANANLYHFVAESLRVLVFALEEGLDFQGIIIRDDLPQNFYDLIEYIAPDKAIYKVKQGEKIYVPTIIACGFETPESQRIGFFSRQGDLNFKRSDDFITFAFIRKKFLVDLENGFIPRVFSSDQFNDKVVFSVRPLRSSRGFFFSGLVTRILKFFGASIIDLNSADLPNTIGLIQSADYFFCESGAGVVNILFGKPDLKFVEISYGNRQNWSTLALALDIHHEEVRVSFLFRIIFKDYLDSNPFPLPKLLFRYLIVRPVLRNL